MFLRKLALNRHIESMIKTTQNNIVDTRVTITGEVTKEYQNILTPEALYFISSLQRNFGPARIDLLEQRIASQKLIDKGKNPSFLQETTDIRNREWKISNTPHDLLDRRVEITGPVERKMVINALNSGAHTFMADFEYSAAPTWELMIDGQINLRDAINKKINYTDPKSGKHYSLKDKTATLIVRPRGWHLSEKHILVDGEPMSASLVDFGLYLFHNAEKLISEDTGPYFYLPKLENHLEARLWNNVFVYAQTLLGLKPGTIKTTVLIETITAAFEMDEILYELRDHIVGLNCGRWDYIFSFIKKFRNRSNMVLPDRGDVGMTQHLMRSYSQLLIQTCHRRGAHAIGGMAAQIPIKNDLEANEAATLKVRNDKEREAGDGHDGTWVAHPGQVPVALEVFNHIMPDSNQIERVLGNLVVTESDLLTLPNGHITESGLRANINVGILYIESWLRGQGCVPLYNLMEDAATAEISRAQIWQWIKHGAQLEDGRKIDQSLFNKILQEETAIIRTQFIQSDNCLDDAIELFVEVSTSDNFIEFLTLPAYELLISRDSEAKLERGDEQ